MRERIHRAAAAILCASILITSAAHGEDPLIVVRDFCSADGDGDRLSPYEWQQIAPLVTWRLEPAWDHLVLISGYEISTPRRTGPDVEVDVEYTVSGEIHPGRVDRGDEESEERREVVTLTLVADGDGGWLVGGPPFPPHVFENVVDPETLADLLDPQSGYLSSSALVWDRLRADGWDVPYTTSAAIPTSSHFHEVGTAQPGDVILYYSSGAPYHVGWLQDDESVLSASLNAGAVVMPFATFPGSIRYWRPQPADPGDPAATPSPAPLRRP